MKIQRFNMIEIMLAMLVISVALLGSMGLFPIGLDNNLQAKEDFYATLSADTMSNYIRGGMECHNLFNSDYGSGCEDYAHLNNYHSFVRVGYGFDIPDKSVLDFPEPITMEDGSFSRTVIPNRITNPIPTGFTLKRSSKGDDYSKYHLLTFATEVDGEKEVDFDCIATVLLNPLTYANGVGRNFKVDSQLGNVFLTVRIEWPASLPPESRSSRTYSYYLY